jgi:hypothetical protein
MKLILATAFCLLVFSPAIADGPSKFDEYAGLTFSGEKPRLDNLAIQLKAAPDMVAWYLIFAGRESCPGEARRRAIMAKNYLVKRHGIEADRIIWVDEGYRESILVELWLGLRVGEPIPSNRNLGRSEARASKRCKPRHNKPRSGFLPEARLITHWNGRALSAPIIIQHARAPFNSGVISLLLHSASLP